MLESMARRGTFQSTHPVRGATCSFRVLAFLFEFQSTHPVRGATSSKAFLRPAIEFQSTHPVRGATFFRIIVIEHRLISIHAPREGCDIFEHARSCPEPLISIHAPREGCDRREIRRRDRHPHFNPRTP